MLISPVGSLGCHAQVPERGPDDLEVADDDERAGVQQRAAALPGEQQQAAEPERAQRVRPVRQRDAPQRPQPADDQRRRCRRAGRCGAPRRCARWRRPPGRPARARAARRPGRSRAGRRRRRASRRRRTRRSWRRRPRRRPATRVARSSRAQRHEQQHPGAERPAAAAGRARRRCPGRARRAPTPRRRRRCTASRVRGTGARVPRASEAARARVVRQTGGS